MIHYYDKPHKSNSNLTHYPAICGNFCDVRLRTEDKRSETISNYSQPGIYPINVFGDPHLWLGLRKKDSTSEPEIVDYVPNFLDEIQPNILQMVREKKLRIAVFSGAEGNSMRSANELENCVTDLDCFRALHMAMRKHDLPPMSVVIAVGDLNASEDYEDWLEKTKVERMFEVTGHPGSFQYLASTDKDITNPLSILSLYGKNTRAYNSLNRIWKNHRAAHLYLLKEMNLLEHGYVSCAYVEDPSHVKGILNIAETDSYIHEKFMEEYPKFLDGRFKDINKADNIFYGLYLQSQLSVVSESLYEQPNNTFFSEKTWKPIYVGHPFIFIASNGHLKHLRKLGYKTELSGIDDTYDNVEDMTHRMYLIHRSLKIWCGFTKEQRHHCILESMDNLKHNMKHYKNTDHFLETINSIEETSERYFHDSL